MRFLFTLHPLQMYEFNRSGFAVFQSNHFSGKWELFSEFHKSLFFRFHWNSFLKKNPFKSLENYLGVSEDGLPRREHRYFNQKYLKSLTTPILSLFWIALGQLVRSDKERYRARKLTCNIYIYLNFMIPGRVLNQTHLV